MQHSTYQDNTFHSTQYSTSHILHFKHTMSEIATFHVAPHTPHFTSHHNSHQIIPPHLGHIPPHGTTSDTFKYKLHITLSHSTHSKSYHTSHTAFQTSFCITPPCLIWRQTIPHHHIPQPHFTSCIAAHHHIPHGHHYSTSHHISQHLGRDIT